VCSSDLAILVIPSALSEGSAMQGHINTYIDRQVGSHET
jgi:hypothetical protein